MKIRIAKGIKDNRKILILFFIVAWVLRIAYLSSRAERLIIFGWIDWWDEMAQNFLIGRGFLAENPFGGSQPFYALRGPIFPVFLLFNHLLFGNNFFLIKVMICLLNALTIFLIYDIAKGIFEKKIGLFAAAISAVFPTFIYFSIVSAPDILATFLLAITISLLLRGSRNNSYLINAIGGIALGLTILCRSAYIAFLPFVLFWQGFVASSSSRGRKSVIIFLFTLLTMMPWVVRNYRIMHAFIPLSTNGGWVFWSANNPYMNKGPRGQCMPTEIENLKEKLKRMSEVEADSYLRQITFSYIRKNPLLYCQRALNRFGRFWALFPHKKYYSYSFWLGSGVIYIPLFLLAFVGALFAKEKQKDCSLFYFLFLSQTIVNMVTRACIRYRLPIEPYLIILATFGFFVIRSKIKCQKEF